MSYQFEDDSALEELLNQQLDRRRTTQQNPPSLSRQPARLAQRDVSDISPSPSTLNSKPFTDDANKQQQAILKRIDDSSVVAPVPSRSKLSSWLDNKSTKTADSQQPLIKQTSSRPDPEVQTAQVQSKSSYFTANDDQPSLDRLLDITLKDDQLQEMSKQQIIKMILGSVVPVVRELRTSTNKSSVKEIDRLKAELELERSKVQSMESRHLEQIRVAEEMWANLVIRLETRLDINERELKDIKASNKELIGRLEDEHKKELERLTEIHQSKREDEKQQFEATLKRRDEYHQLEMESKMKVDYNIVKLDTIFAEWDKMIEAAISKFGTQLKSIDELLSKQTIEINGTNQELAEKTKLLLERYDNFGAQNNRLDTLCREITDKIPVLHDIQVENGSLTKQISAQLSEFHKKDLHLSEKGSELERLRVELLTARDKLNEQKFELGLDANRLAYKEERLNELMRKNEETEHHLKEERRKGADHELRLATVRASLDSRSNELKHQNFDLHLIRKKLTEKEEHLSQLEVQLSDEQNTLLDKQKQLNEDKNELIGLRNRTKEELNQLRRLQKSLICSICLTRLFRENDQIGADQQTRFGYFHGQFNGRPKNSLKYEIDIHKDFDISIANLSQRMKIDAKQLENESRLVDLITME